MTVLLVRGDNDGVAKYRIESLAELARQLPFTPLDTRTRQVAAAEELLHTIEPLKAYPLEFIIFRITGYRPRHHSDTLLTGLALQNDLSLLIEAVSETLELRTQTLAEPVLRIEDVTERFNVTSKTIQRWRRKGLPARRFIFPDGKRRVGFFVSSVERFFAAHRDQAPRGINFARVEEDEQGRIVAMARRLVAACRCSESEIARRIARRLNRTPSTVLHVLRKHDEEQPERAVLTAAAPDLTADERARIVRGHERGMTLAALAARARRSRADVYRVILDERLEKLNRRKVKYVDDPLYHDAGARSAIDAIMGQEDLGAQPAVEETRVPRDLPSYLQSLYRTPLLTPARERALFLKFNFHKQQFASARRKLDPALARARDIDCLEGHLREAVDTKNQIVSANLRLVVSVARKHLRPELSLMELVSEGNITLMRAVEGFDIHRGHRFSTYATLALMKGFARSVGEMLAHRSMNQGDGILDGVPDDRVKSAREQFSDREQVRELLTRLDERERDVLQAHFGLDDRALPATLHEVGRRMGLSKQRVRQIEKTALAKLRIAPQ